MSKLPLTCIWHTLSCRLLCAAVSSQLRRTTTPVMLLLLSGLGMQAPPAHACSSSSAADPAHAQYSAATQASRANAALTGVESRCTACSKVVHMCKMVRTRTWAVQVPCRVLCKPAAAQTIVLSTRLSALACLLLAGLFAAGARWLASIWQFCPAACVCLLLGDSRGRLQGCVLLCWPHRADVQLRRLGAELSCSCCHQSCAHGCREAEQVCLRRQRCLVSSCGEAFQQSDLKLGADVELRGLHMQLGCSCCHQRCAHRCRKAEQVCLRITLCFTIRARQLCSAKAERCNRAGRAWH